jgi:cobalt transporter subunit CbtA
VSRFRKLMFAVFVSGAVSGLALFVVQRFTVIPLIETAETYEAAQRAEAGSPDEEGDWKPSKGWERTSFTAITTTLTGIGFAAILFGSLALAGAPVSARRGALWGLAAFACFGLAPAFGLPPQPPGVALAGLAERQIWWIGTALATAAGLWLLAGKKRAWPLRVAGIVCLLLPHLIGAPVGGGENAVPAQLIRRFAITSLLTTGIFWLVLGMTGGFLCNRFEADREEGLNATMHSPGEGAGTKRTGR